MRDFMGSFTGPLYPLKPDVSRGPPRPSGSQASGLHVIQPLLMPISLFNGC